MFIPRRQSDSFHLDFSRLPANPGMEKRAWLSQFVIPAYESHTPANVLRWLFPDFFQYLITVTLPHSALVILAIAGILSLKDIRRRTFGVFMLTFLPAYACVVFFLVHYLFPLLAIDDLPGFYGLGIARDRVAE